jgi:hypothetical protein
VARGESDGESRAAAGGVVKRISLIFFLIARAAIADEDPMPAEPAPAPPPPVAAAGSLVLAPEVAGHFEILRIGENGQVPVATFDKLEGELSRFALPDGDYRIRRTGERFEPVSGTIHINPGEEVVLGLPDFPGPEPLPQPIVQERPRYPLGLAARPLTLPAHMIDLTLTYYGDFTASDYSNDLSHLLQSTFSLTDRFSIRDLGVYYALSPKRGAIPEVAVGGGLVGISYAGDTGVQLSFAAYADIKEHFTERVAVQLRGVYTLILQTSNVLPLDHEVAAGIDLLFDVATRISLIVAGDYDFHRLRTTQGVDNSPTIDAQRISPSLALSVSPVNWLDVRTGIGPSWTWADGVPVTLGGRWHVAVRFRW